MEAHSVETDKQAPLFIRPLTPADTAELLRFYESLPPAVTSLFRPFAQINEPVMKTHLDQAARREHISLGLVRPDGAVEGHGFIFSVRKEKPVFGIGLRPRVRGRGWGRKLVEAVLDEADRQGLPRVTLTVLKHNSPAKALYREMGFEIKGEATFVNQNDSYYMERVFR